MLTKKINGDNAFIGIICGFACNLFFWIYLDNVSWLWWNVIGFIATFLAAYVHNYFFYNYKSNETYVWSLNFLHKSGLNDTWIKRYIILFIWFVLIFCSITFFMI